MALDEVTTAAGDTYPVEYVDPHTLRPGDRIIAHNRDGDPAVMTVKSAHGVYLAIEGEPGMLRVPFGGVHRITEAGSR